MFYLNKSKNTVILQNGCKFANAKQQGFYLYDLFNQTCSS